MNIYDILYMTGQVIPWRIASLDEALRNPVVAMLVLLLPDSIFCSQVRSLFQEWSRRNEECWGRDAGDSVRSTKGRAVLQTWSLAIFNLCGDWHKVNSADMLI